MKGTCRNGEEERRGRKREEKTTVKKKKDSTEQTEKNIATPPSQTKRLSHTPGQGREEERKKGREKERKQTEAVPRDKDVRPKKPQELGTERRYKGSPDQHRIMSGLIRGSKKALEVKDMKRHNSEPLAERQPKTWTTFNKGVTHSIGRVKKSCKKYQRLDIL